ncbi:MAG: GYD domain-containing protein, partial [Methanomicrobiales archaeon]|nr:GYD domain-containing protein [Methanomicrobiales archaeon]
PLPMPLFVILGKLTQKAIEDIKRVAERDSKGEQIVKAAGGKLLAHYYTFGRYDFVIVAELPSTEALARVLIDVSKWGTIRTETMTALLPEQMYKVAMTT